MITWYCADWFSKCYHLSFILFQKKITSIPLWQCLSVFIKWWPHTLCFCFSKQNPILKAVELSTGDPEYSLWVECCACLVFTPQIHSEVYLQWNRFSLTINFVICDFQVYCIMVICPVETSLQTFNDLNLIDIIIEQLTTKLLVPHWIAQFVPPMP